MSGGLLGISDRTFAIYMFMVFATLATIVCAASVALTVLMGWPALIIVIPLVIITGPPIVYMLHDTAATIRHNDILWRGRR